jgi:hypothetical protein
MAEDSQSQEVLAIAGSIEDISFGLGLAWYLAQLILAVLTLQ